MRRKYWLSDPPATCPSRRRKSFDRLRIKSPLQTLTGRYFYTKNLLRREIFSLVIRNREWFSSIEIHSRVEDSVESQWFETLEREAEMAKDARNKFTPLFAPRKTGLEWVDDHKQQVRIWFAGLPSEDQQEIIELIQAQPLLTHQALREIAESRKPC